MLLLQDRPQQGSRESKARAQSAAAAAAGAGDQLGAGQRCVCKCESEKLEACPRILPLAYEDFLNMRQIVITISM